MPSIIYTDTVIGDDGSPINNTPAGLYAVADLATILDRIRDGSIPCGTGQTYPVEWEGSSLPWDENKNNRWRR